MKTRTKKILYAAPIVVLLVLCGCLIRMLPSADEGEEIPAMGEPYETTEETEAPETEAPETEAPETLPPPDLSSKGLSFESLGDGVCVISGIGSCTDRVVRLPEKSPEGEIVIGIGDYAFRGCEMLSGIEFNPTICSIGAYAFYGSALEGITIPDTVTSIGEYAFCGCYSLQSIEVSPENPSYSDENGVLMSKAGDVILAYPAGRSDNFYSISSKVREIRTMAFYNCNAIKMIHYAGNVSSFGRILVGAGNEALVSAIVTYSNSTDLFTDKQEPTSSEK